MAAQTLSDGQRRVNRRELTMVVFLASLALGALGLAAMLLWFSVPRLDTIMIGALSDFPPSDQPYQIAQGAFYAYIVNIDGDLFVFDAHTPVSHFRYKWVPINNRFEDPASGNKFAPDGTWVEGPAPRNLDRYAYEIRRGKIYINTEHIIEGEERRKPAAGP